MVVAAAVAVAVEAAVAVLAEVVAIVAVRNTSPLKRSHLVRKVCPNGSISSSTLSRRPWSC
jgi:hypothetical protein